MNIAVGSLYDVAYEITKAPLITTVFRTTDGSTGTRDIDVIKLLLSHGKSVHTVDKFDSMTQKTLIEIIRVTAYLECFHAIAPSIDARGHVYFFGNFPGLATTIGATSVRERFMNMVKERFDTLNNAPDCENNIDPPWGYISDWGVYFSSSIYYAIKLMKNANGNEFVGFEDGNGNVFTTPFPINEALNRGMVLQSIMPISKMSYESVLDYVILIFKCRYVTASVEIQNGKKLLTITKHIYPDGINFNKQCAQGFIDEAVLPHTYDYAQYAKKSNISLHVRIEERLKNQK